MSQPPAWVSDYVGLPFLERGRTREGCDCWGLIRLVLAGRFGVEVPSYSDDYESLKDHERLAALVASGKEDGWQEVPAGQERPGDVLELRMSGLPIHVGIVVAPSWMLHTRQATDAVVERFDGMAWGRRVVGVYRHASL